MSKHLNTYFEFLHMQALSGTSSLFGKSRKYLFMEAFPELSSLQSDSLMQYYKKNEDFLISIFVSL